MTNVYTLKDINNKGHRLGSTYEQELEKKLYTTLSSKAEINDLCEKLLAKNSEYSEREEEFQRICADMENKASQLNVSSTELKSKFISERRSRIELEAKVKSLKSNIKTLKREATLAQKASSTDMVQILSLETKIRELEGELDDLKLEQAFHDSDAVGGLLEEPAQINLSDPKEIDSLRLELEQVRDDLSSKKYEIECMEKGIESSKNIYNQTIDSLFSARSNLIEVNRSLKEQLALKKNNEVDHPPSPMNNSSCIAPDSKNPSGSGQPSSLNLSSQIISVGGAEVISLPATASIITNSLISPMLIYSILTLVLIAIIWFMVRKWWNSQKKSNQYFTPFFSLDSARLSPAEAFLNHRFQDNLPPDKRGGVS